MLHLKKKKKNTRRYHYFTPAYQKSWWYDLQFWDIDCDRLKLVIVGLFCPFLSPPPPLPPPSPSPKKTQITDTIFCQFGPLFALLNHLTTWIIKILKKWKKKHLEIISFYTCVPQMTIIRCMVPEIWSATVRIFCHFGHFLPFYPTNNLRYHHFTKVYWKAWSYAVLFLRYGMWRI